MTGTGGEVQLRRNGSDSSRGRVRERRNCPLDNDASGDDRNGSPLEAKASSLLPLTLRSLKRQVHMGSSPTSLPGRLMGQASGSRLCLALQGGVCGTGGSILGAP